MYKRTCLKEQVTIMVVILCSKLMIFLHFWNFQDLMELSERKMKEVVTEPKGLLVLGGYNMDYVTEVPTPPS